MGSTQEAAKQKMCACRLHDRMPVLLTCDEHADAWLGTEPLSTKYVCLLAVLTLCTVYFCVLVPFIPSMYIGTEALQA